MTPRVTVQDGKYQIAVQVPFTTTNPQASLHTLLAVAQDRISSAPLVMANRPSHWHVAQPGSDIAMVTYGGFATTLLPLIRAHQAEGETSAVVPVVELYDEFNFGEHSPVAIKRFLQSAKKNWKKPLAYLSRATSKSRLPASQVTLSTQPGNTGWALALLANCVKIRMRWYW